VGRLLDVICAYAKTRPDAIALDGNDPICGHELAELLPILSGA
jgi:hypothetical protein